MTGPEIKYEASPAHPIHVNLEPEIRERLCRYVGCSDSDLLPQMILLLLDTQEEQAQRTSKHEELILRMSMKIDALRSKLSTEGLPDTWATPTNS